MNIYLLILVIGLIIIFSTLAMYLLMPFYLPYYSVITKNLISNQYILNIPPNTTLVLKNVTLRQNNYDIEVITNSSNVNVIIVNPNGVAYNNTGYIIYNPEYLGNYTIELGNPSDSQINVRVNYAILPSSYISSFYSFSGIISTFLEVLFVIGIIVSGYGLIRVISSKRTRSN
ncbi:hypothetical protein SUSAZ_10945 [Sulfolobus acidocaldarius SUSAZ]|nr:hypothetical protein SUSAZ_10945 [Sulfolobus acidocaldarius SUSAZ]